MYTVLFCDLEKKYFGSDFENLDQAISFVESVLSSHFVVEFFKVLPNNGFACLKIYKDLSSSGLLNESDYPDPVFVSDIFVKHFWEK